MGLITPFNYLVFDGKSSADFGVWISGGGTFNAPARDVETVAVPGRNGLLYFDNGRFNNTDVVYPAFISRDFEPRIKAFRAWLCSKVGYKRLEDTYHPDEYRKAIYKSGLDVTAAVRNLGGSFDLAFDCMPQRFLKSGEIPVRFEAGGVLFNPTVYTAKPVIRCIGTAGSVTVGGVSVEITGASTYADIDCEEMEVTEGSTLLNSTTVLTDGAFPVIDPGKVEISFSGFSAVEITPNWWTL